ncbi:MAG: zinc ribbon domain-containing protein [Dissulfurispiraceae bacterium]
MDEQLHRLVDLQKLDTNILNLRLKIDSIPSLVTAEEAPYKKALKAFESARQQQSLLEKKKKDKEIRIEDLAEKIRKLKARSSEIKTNKEYQANLKEIETVEAEIRSAEDDILAVMEVMEAASKSTEAENARLAEAKTMVEALSKEKEQEIRIIEQELQTLKETRKQLAEKIEPELYTLYMNLLKAGRGLAVSEAKNELCGGCNMNIPPQLFVEIKSSGSIFRCPQCRRILYYEKPSEENQEPAVAN